MGGLEVAEASRRRSGWGLTDLLRRGLGCYGRLERSAVFHGWQGGLVDVKQNVIE